ncbi:MAG: hypothetical protein A2Y10_09165 [Planctomycetes bacterium GWF2_41_51]|nr:MAG: hypothetical protein A2Y10_09165 [Planctomycetes bacterium GWF2_41_51]HBG26711.1 hypothetical protein [Phycisphaerales bacterium]
MHSRNVNSGYSRKKAFTRAQISINFRQPCSDNKQYVASQNKFASEKLVLGFTLVELLVVISIIAMLLAVLMPALSKARAIGKSVKCAAQMKQFGLATHGYVAENQGCLPFYGLQSDSDNEGDYEGPFWFDTLAPYFGNNTKKDSSVNFHQSDTFLTEVRMCPAGQWIKSSFVGGKEWNCWIGVNFGRGNNQAYPLSAPFYYRKHKGFTNPALQLANIKTPGQVMGFMDVQRHFVYSPYDRTYQFDYDGDKDPQRLADMCSARGKQYNAAQPRIHYEGCNVGLLDGHVKRVTFKELWKINKLREIEHQYWKIKKR